MDTLKNIIKNNLTNTNLNIGHIKNTVILSMTCFWSKCNFSAIIRYRGVKYYCYYDNTKNDIVIEYA